MYILGIFPHPDDESYSAAGSLARALGAGDQVGVICLTRGEAGQHRAGVVPPGPHLGTLRAAEARTAGGRVGFHVEVMGFPDGGLAEEPTLSHMLSGVLADLEPDVVVTLGRDGVYGHKDHLACTAAVEQAVKEAKKKSRLLHCAFKPGLFDGIRDQLAQIKDDHGNTCVDPSVSLGTPEDAVSLKVNIREHAATKLKAISAHRSQLVNGDPHSFLGGNVVEQLLDEEWFTLVAGPSLPKDADSLTAGL